MTTPEMQRRCNHALAGASAFLRDAGTASVTVTTRFDSTESVCLQLNTPDAKRYVLKIMRPNASLGKALREFDALCDLYEALVHHPGVLAPEPITALTSADAYMMRYMEGIPLRSCIEFRTLDVSDLTDIAGRLAIGLTAFHDKSRQPYADFHPENVLVSGSACRVVFLDPTHSAHYLYAPAEWTKYGWPSSDIGYWTFSTVVRSARRYFHELRGSNGLIALTVQMIDATAALLDLPRKAFAEEVLAVAEWHRKRMARLGFKELALSCVSKPWSLPIGRAFDR